MRIIELQVENLKKLLAVTIRPDGNLVEISGRNGAGKSSTLDSIWYALAGTRNICAKPIRKGAEQALIKLDLGQIRVTRTFTLKEDGDYTTTLKVEKDDGSRPSSPQALLDSVVGELTFDPLAFTRMKPDEQFDALKRFVPGVDFAALAAADREDYDARTAANRRAKELRAQADGITLPAGKVPKPVDVDALEKQLGDAADHNSTLAQRQARRDAVRGDLDRLAATRDGLRARAEDLRNQAAQAEAEADQINIEIVEGEDKIAKAEPLPEPIDTADVREKLAAARANNEAATRAKQKADLEEKAREFEAESVRLTKAMEDREVGKQAAIAEASMPVNGISFADGGVLLGGVPFDQASAAEQLRASVAIAAAMNPTLRIVRISDGSLLDDDAMAWLARFADEHDLQVWIETIHGGPAAFIIENGHLQELGAGEAV